MCDALDRPLVEFVCRFALLMRSVIRLCADTPVKRLLDSSGGVEGLIAAAAAGIPRLALSPQGAPVAGAKGNPPNESPSGSKRIRSPMKPKHDADGDENAEIEASVRAPARAIV